LIFPSDHSGEPLLKTKLSAPKLRLSRVARPRLLSRLAEGLWRPLAIGYAVILLISLLLLGRSWPTFSFMAAIAMNIAILVILLWLDWPVLDRLTPGS
jgi:hypothetical protein